MAVSSTPIVQSHISLPTRAEHINRIDHHINANNRKINALENQITAQKEVSAVTRELIAGNSESIALTKEIITTNEALIATKKEMIANNKALIDNVNRKIDILEQLKASSDRLIGTHQERLGLLQESRDLTKESRDLLQKMIDVVEKMIAIMVKNPAKYEGLPNTEIQKQPEVIEAKSNIVTTAVSVKVEHYPKEEHIALSETVKNVVDTSFTEIKPADTKANSELFNNLGKRIEAALDKKHETLAAKTTDIRQIMNVHYYRPLENFSRMNKLAYLDLAIKDMKA